MKQTRIVLISALVAFATASMASSSSPDDLSPYQITDPSMLQNLQPATSRLPTVSPAGGRRLKAAKQGVDQFGATGSGQFDAASQAAFDRFSQFRQKDVSQSATKSVGINTAQQQALSRLAAEMPDQSTGFRAYFDGKNSTPSFIKFKSTPRIMAMRGEPKQIAKATSRQFLNDYRELLKIEDPDQELSLKRESSDDLGNQHYLYQQMVNGVPVWGSELIIHLRKDNSAYLLNGRFQPTIKIDTTAKLMPEQAEERVREALDVSSVYRINSELIVYPVDGGEPRLAYEVDVLANMADRWLYFIDAHTGEVIHRISYSQQVSVNASGTDEFDNTVNFRAWEQNSVYYMLDSELPVQGTSPNPLQDLPAFGDTLIYDANHGEGDSVQVFIVRSNSPNSGWDSAAVTAMDGISKVYQYYLNTFNRNSIDDAGMNLMGVVHWGTNYANAFWNGSHMIFGDGDGQNLTSLARCHDVIAHELTHGVVQATAALRYENQSGALNEAYADIFGTMVDREDWTIAEDCTLIGNGYIRNLADPTLGVPAQPTKMSEYENLPNTEDGDWGGVHINNSIPSLAAYLMAEGLSGRGLGTSIGREKVEQIFYRALTTYLTASSQFIDARHATLQSAEDLYGANSAETNAVSQAWDIVEVTDDGSTPTDPSPTPTDPVNGNDLMVYIYPNENGVNSLYAQIMNDPLSYVQENDLHLQYNSTDVSANPKSRPAAYTSDEESVVFYVGEDENLYEIDISQVGSSSPIFAHYQISDTGGFWSIALAPDGHYFAFTSTDSNDNNIHVWDLQTSTTYDYEITPPDYSDGGTQGTASAVLYADALAFDYTGRYIAFDALNCISTDNSTCDSGGGYRYWSIGVMDASDGTIFYPVSSQSPNLNIGFPSFAQNNNFVIAVDVIDYSQGESNPSSRSMALNFETQESLVLHNYGTSSEPHFSVPSFWGDDLGVTLLMPGSSDTYAVRKLLNTNGDSRWEALNGSVEPINSYAVRMPVMHRAGIRSTTGNVSPSTSQVNFGSVNIGELGTFQLVLSNNGNSDVNINNIQLNSADFTLNGTNGLLPRGGSVSWDLAFAPSAAGARTDTLTISTDAEVSAVTVALTGTGIDSGTGDSDTGGDDTGGDDTGGDDTGGDNTGGDNTGNEDESSSGGGGLLGFEFLLAGLFASLLSDRRKRRRLLH